MSRAGVLGDDARFELAMAAAGRERNNRPRALVIMAVAALVLTAVTAAWGLTSRRAAHSRLSRTLADQVAIETMAAEWMRLAAEEKESGSQQIGNRMPDLLSKLEGMATQAGLQDKPNPPRQTQQARAGLNVIEYYYTNVKDPSLKPLLEWLRLATSQIPGLEVYSLTLRPDPNNWNMTVTFRRWERGGAG